MKSIRSAIIGLGMLAATGILHAQSISTSSTDLAAMVEAVSQTTPTSAEEIPRGATFFSAQHPNWPPYPGNFYNLPAWGLGDNVYLLDDLDFDASAMSSSSMMSADSMSPPGFDETGDGSGYTNTNTSTFFIDTNLLWLEISNISSGTIHANLHVATNQVYAVWQTTNLCTSWQVEMELWPATNETSVMPFTLPTLNRAPLFLRAQDWTGVTENGNTTPNWWLWLYFGTTALSDTNLDVNGKTLLYDFTNHIAPGTFSFSGIEVANNHVNSSSAAVQLGVVGRPYYLAVLVDDTNYANAVWSVYSASNVVVNLGMTEGWHDVRMGLRGHADNASAAVWQWNRLKLDFTPPSLVVTGLTNNTISVPLMQLTGYSPEALTGISYDISNALGIATNQQAMIIGQAYSTNAVEFTTNYFQCYDVPLAGGTNAITLYALDSAGNVATLATNIIYTPSTNPPVVVLFWPQEGMRIINTNFTVQGLVNDPTATVSVAVVDAGGNTNVFDGLTGRDGNFWIPSIPLNPGTNSISVSISDSAGTTTTNFTVIQTNAALTINTVVAGQTPVTGLIGVSDYTVWVNGVQAAQTNGTWTAPITPIGVGGGVVNVTAIPNSDNGGNGSGGGGGGGGGSGGGGASTANPSSAQSLNTQITVAPPQGPFISMYHLNDHVTYLNPCCSGSPGLFFEIKDWEDGQGGSRASLTLYNDFRATLYVADWSSGSWPQTAITGTGTNIVGYVSGLDYSTLYYATTNSGQPDPGVLGQEHCNFNRTVTIGDNVPYYNDQRNADTEMKLATGGPLGSKQKNLWQISASASDAITGVPIPYDQISIGSFGKLDTNGNLYVVLPDNDPDVITPRVSGSKNYNFSINGKKYTGVISWNNGPVITNSAKVIVGQFINLTSRVQDANGNLPPVAYSVTNYSWTVAGYAISNFYVSSDSSTGKVIEPFPKTNSQVSFFWVDGGSKQVSCDMTVMGKTLTAQANFNVVRPTAKVTTHTTSVGISTFANSFGFFDTNTFAEGITLTNTMTIPPGYAGTNEWIQIVSNPYRSLQGANGTNWVLTENGAPPYLDTSYPYKNKYGITANIAFDSPSMALSTSYPVMTLSNTFKMWLMFKPTGGQWVPLRVVNWNCSGTASLSGTNWVLSNQSWSANPIDADSGTTYPQWNSNVTNATYQIQP